MNLDSSPLRRRSFLSLAAALPSLATTANSQTEVSVRGNQFFINGKPSYAGRSYKGLKIEGLLMNVRAVQAIFDDLNPRPAPDGRTPTRVNGTRSAMSANSWRSFPVAEPRRSGVDREPPGRQP